MLHHFTTIATAFGCTTAVHAVYVSKILQSSFLQLVVLLLWNICQDFFEHPNSSADKGDVSNPFQVEELRVAASSGQQDGEQKRG